MPLPKIPALYLLVPPQQQDAAARFHLTPAHLAYRVGSGSHLFRTQLPIPLKDGIMVLDHQGFDGAGKAELFCQEIVRECSARGFQGLFCDFEGKPIPLLARAIALLSPTFQKRGWTLYVPASYASATLETKVVISTAISGGSLRQYLRETIDTYGLERVVLGLQWTREDFTLPARSGSGASISSEELSDLLKKRRPSVYYSSELCANYFTFMPTGGEPHFILFDNAVTMEKKLQLAAEMGIREAFLPCPDSAEELSVLFSSKPKEIP